VRYLPDTVKRPQMQWNHVHITRPDPMFAKLPSEPWMYFVHSLHPLPQDESCIVATTDYGCAVTAAVRKDNVFAVQFHPEKSAVDGLALLGNFVDAARLVAA
jgi:glutamine amidotransferase